MQLRVLMPQSEEARDEPIEEVPHVGILSLLFSFLDQVARCIISLDSLAQALDKHIFGCARLMRLHLLALPVRPESSVAARKACDVELE